MEQGNKTTSRPDLGGGVVTLRNTFSVPDNASPNAMNVKFGVGSLVEKRYGSTTLNSTALIPGTVTGFSPDSSGILGISLVSFWKLEEQSGTRVDSFGSNSLLDNNSVGFSSGIIGNAAQFVSANSQYLSAQSNMNLAFGNTGFSISCWVYLNNTAVQTIIGRAGEAGDLTDREYILRFDGAVGAVQNSNLFEFQVTTSGSTATSVSGGGIVNITTSTWYHVVVWHNDTADLINISVNTAAITSASHATGVRANSNTFSIGRLGDYVPTNYVNGLVDEVGLWSKVLTPQERRDLFNSGSANTYVPALVRSGWGMFDFGAGRAAGQPLRWLVVAAGTGIYATSTRIVGAQFTVVGTGRGANYQFFERSKNLLVATSDTYNKVLWWAGSAGTQFQVLAQGSAPPAKHALDFQGFLLLMNDSSNSRLVTYSDNNVITTDPWNDTFEIPGQTDDEITGGVVFNRNAYIFTKYTVNRVTHVGGNPDFSVLPVKSWGAIPGTIKKATYTDKGEVIISMGWDRHVRIFDGSDELIISTPIEEDNGQCDAFLNGIPDDSLPKCRAEVDTEEQVYRLNIIMSPSSETTHAWCLNLRTGIWYPYDNQGFNAMTMSDSGNNRILAGVKRDGFVHWINTTNTDAGTAIDEFLQSPLIFSNTPRTITKSKNATLYLVPTSSGELHYQDRTNFSPTFRPTREKISLSDTGNFTVIQKVIDVPVTTTVYEWKVSSSASTANPWKLLRYDFDHKDLGKGEAG